MDHGNNNEQQKLSGNLNNISNWDVPETGKIYLVNNKSHIGGFSFTDIGSVNIPAMYIDVTKFDLIPNNRHVSGNVKIINMYVDYSTNPWKLIIEVCIDAVSYTKTLIFDS